MVPPLKYFNKPILEILSDNNEWTKLDISYKLVELLKLTKEDIKEKTKSGKNTKFQDRLSWSLVYLKKAGVINGIKKARYIIAEAGKAIVEEHKTDEFIDNNILSKYSEAFDCFQNTWRKKIYKGKRQIKRLI